MSWKEVLKSDYEIEGPEELVNSIANAKSIDELKTIVEDNEIKYLDKRRDFGVKAINVFLQNLERNGYSNLRFITRRHGLRQRVAELLEEKGMIVDEYRTTVFDPKHKEYDAVMRRFREGE